MIIQSQKPFNSQSPASHITVLHATVLGVYYLILCSHCVNLKRTISMATKYKGVILKSVSICSLFHGEFTIPQPNSLSLQNTASK